MTTTGRGEPGPGPCRTTCPTPPRRPARKRVRTSSRAGAELLDRTWKALAAAQPMYHAVLLFRVENPDVPSPRMAEQLAARLGTPMRPDQVRKALQRSHARFAELLLDEVATSLGNPSREELAEEVRELDLLKYCRSALERWT